MPASWPRCGDDVFLGDVVGGLDCDVPVDRPRVGDDGFIGEVVGGLDCDAPGRVVDDNLDEDDIGREVDADGDVDLEDLPIERSEEVAEVCRGDVHLHTGVGEGERCVGDRDSLLLSLA